MIGLKYVILSIIWLSGLIYILAAKKKDRQYLKIIRPIFLTTLGVLSNTTEILATGVIKDFIDLSKIGIPWPIFNIADILIVTGLGWLIVSFLRSGQRF